MLDFPVYLTIYHQAMIMSNLGILSYGLILHPHAVHMCEKNIFHKDIHLRRTYPFFLEFFFVVVISKIKEVILVILSFLLHACDLPTYVSSSCLPGVFVLFNI